MLEVWLRRCQTKIRLYNSVNLKYGYPLLEIRSPREVVYEEGQEI